MKIASRIKPRNGQPRNVHVNGRLYAFAAAKDKNGDTHFIADVNDPDHAAILLGSEHFYELGKDQQAVSTLKRSAEPATANAEQVAAGPTDTANETLRAAASGLLACSANTIAVNVGKVASLDVVRTALAMEREAGARKTVIHLLEATLQGAAAAGVKG